MQQYPKPPLPRQHQPMPGRTDQMRPKPDHGEESYRGSGKLAGKNLSTSSKLRSLLALPVSGLKIPFPESRAHLDRAIELYDPAKHRLLAICPVPQHRLHRPRSSR
jgi:hypothetical protein